MSVTLSEPLTYLSPSVHRLICKVGVDVKEIDDGEQWLSGGVINLDHLDKVLPENEDSYEYFCTCVYLLAPLFGAAEKQLGALSVQEFTSQYGKHLNWTSAPQVLHDCFSLASSGDDSESLLSLLLSTSVLERSLGDMYLLRGSQCPSMLKDLLVTPELAAIFGKAVIRALRVLIGPPISLNLRNVAWHGFPAPGEIPKRYMYTVLLVAASLGHLLQKKGIRSEKIPHRAMIKLTQAAQLEGTLSGLTDSGADELLETFEQSPFISTAMKPIWRLAVNRYKNARYGECVVLLLPQLELGLRRVFTAVNNSHDRLLTAENTTLFTTFDEILQQRLPDNTLNKLHGFLGNKVMDMLYDLLVHPEGVRVRDRVSHGETCTASLPQSLASHIIGVCACLAVHFLNVSSLQAEVIIRLRKCGDQYTSQFHPVSILKRQMCGFCSSLSEWREMPKHDEDKDQGLGMGEAAESSETSPFRHELWLDLNLTLQTYVPQVPELNVSRYAEAFCDNTHMSEMVQDIEFDTFHNVEEDTGVTRLQGENLFNSEWVGLLRRLVGQADEVAQQVRLTVTERHRQLLNKELRSRQRNTYRRMINSLPMLSSGLQLCLLCAAAGLYMIKYFEKLTDVQCNRLIKFYKSLLQYCENLYTNTSSDKNRWDESVTLTTALVEKVEVFCQMSR